MKKSFYILPILALGLGACSQDVLNPEDSDNVLSNEQQQESKGLTNADLAVFKGNPSRITYANATRAGWDDELAEGQLELVASIANPSKAEGFNFSKEEGGRWMSATNVFYNEEDQTYYVTYHIQGNNYNTQLTNDIGGAVQTFKINDDGTVELGDGFRAASPNKEDYDFNHLYFDKNDNRIIVVGHRWRVPSSWTSEEDYTGKRDNTNAIIGLFNPVAGTVKYKTIQTEEKAYDEQGRSLGYKDAGDANCVIRLLDYPRYYVATRKGLAVLHSSEEKLFEPVVNPDSTNYFVPTPGSCKFVFDTPRVGSMFDFLYLTAPEKSESYSHASGYNIAQFQVWDGSETDNFHGLIGLGGENVTYYDSKDLDILSYGKQIKSEDRGGDYVITPTDGKNTLWVNEDYEYYAALGTSGMYYTYHGTISSRPYEGVMKFGNRPVNCVVMDLPEYESDHDGFIYVANGAKLTILHRRTMQEVASYNIPFVDEDGNQIASSANYIHVRKVPRVGDSFDMRERIITVAFGQEGVKIFRFKPEHKPNWVWELGLE